MAVRITDGSLSWSATIDDSDINRIAARIESRISGLSRNVQQEGKAMEDLFKRAAAAAATFFSIQAGTGLVKDLVRVRGEFQQLEVAFSTILGSKEKADILMAQAVLLAAKTPFTLQEVGSGAKQLLAYGFSAQSVTENLTMLGNIASGVSAPLNDIVYLYGTLQTQGRAYTKDIMQFTGRGIPIIAELAKQFGVAESEVSAMVEAGKVGFPQVEKAFQSLTGQGGMFFNLMAEQSKTLTGQISNLEDAIATMFNEIGRGNQTLLSDGISALAFLVENYEDVIRILGVLITTYGGYRAALALTVATQLTAAQASAGVTVAFKLQYFWINLVEKAQKLLNATMLNNPYVLAATAIVALGSAMIALHDNTTDQEKALRSLNDRAAETTKHFDELVQKTSQLNAVVRSETSTKYTQIQAFKDLQTLYPELLKNKKLEEYQNISLTKSQKLLNEEIDKQKLSTKVQEYNDAVAKVGEYEKSVRSLKEAQKDAGNQGTGLNATIKKANEDLRVAKIEVKELGEQVKKTKQLFWEANTPIEEQKKHWQAVIEKIITQKNEIGRSNSVAIKLGETAFKTRSFLDALSVNNLNISLEEAQIKLDALIGKKAQPVKRTITKIDQEIDILKDDQKGSSSRAEYLSYQKKINVLEKERLAITGESEKAINNAANALKKSNEERLAFLKGLADKEFEIRIQTTEKTEAEVLRIQREYEEKRAEAAKLNLGAGVIQRINNAEKSEIGFLKTERDAELLKISLAKQKQLFEEFEEFKAQLGEKEALKRFGSELNGFRNYGQVLKAEIEKINKLPQKDLSAAQRESLISLKEDLETFNQEQKSADNRKYQEAYMAAMTFNQKIEKINADFAARAKIIRDDAAKEGRNPDAQIAVLNESWQAVLNGEKENALKRIEVYQNLNEQVITLTRSQIQEQLKSIASLLKDPKLSNEIKEGLKGITQGLTNELNLGSEASLLSALEKNKAKIETKINERKKLNISSPESISELKSLYNQLVLIQAQIDKINKKGLSGFLDKLKDSKTLKGVTDGLSLASQAANTMSQALGGVNTKAGYTLDTIGQLAGAAADIGGAIMSGNPVQMVGAAIKAVGTLFSIGKKVKEMNAAARKEVEDFYANAISGERAYQDLLTERELQTVRINKTALKGIMDEVALRKKQLESYSKETAEIMAKLQGQSSITSETYKHGTWFRKAQVNKTYSSLAGKSFAELSQLLAQGKLEGDAKALVERLKEIEQKGYDAEQAMADLAQQVSEIFTGTTSDNLTDKLANMFRSGKTGVQDLADFFKETMDDAAMSIFKNKVLSDMMLKFYDEFNKAAQSDEDLTESEIKNLQTYFFSLTDEATKKFEALKKITGSDLTSPSGNGSSAPTGAIRKELTEETGGKIEGITRLNVEVNKQTNIILTPIGKDVGQLFIIAKSNLETQLKIERNTSNTVVELQNAIVELKEINYNTKPVLTPR